MSTTLSPITEADKPEWLGLWQQYLAFYHLESLPESITNTTFARFLDPSEPVWALVLREGSTPDGKMIGFVHYVFHRSTLLENDCIYLHDLFVDPAVRSKGNGRKLIEAVYAEADKHEVKKVYWHTQRFNHRAQLLYTKVGVRDDFVSYQRPK